MNNEIQKFWEDNKKAIIIVVIVVLAVLSSFAKAAEIESVPPGSFYEKGEDGVVICFNISETQIACGFAPRGTWAVYDKEKKEEEKTSFEFEV